MNGKIPTPASGGWPRHGRQDVEPDRDSAKQPHESARPGGPGHHQRAEARQGTVGTMPSRPINAAAGDVVSPAALLITRIRPQPDCSLASARVAAGLGRAGRLFTAARAAARAAAVVGAPAGEQAAAGTSVGRSTGAAGGLSGTAGRFGRRTSRLGSGAARFGGTAGGLGRTGRSTVAALTTAATAGSGGGVGDHQADGDGAQDGDDRGKTLHEILLVRNETASQSIDTRMLRTRPRPAGRLRATNARAP